MLPDPVPAVEAILRRCSQAQLVSKYKIEEYNNVSEFLVKLAHRLGRMKKGGIPDTTMAARSVINDWIIGKITYSTEPPYTDTVEENLDLSLKDNAMDISEFPTN
ncbi:Stress response protein nst1, variant 2 [Schistosoma haematobium]|nr:Stress response protein nst1, variant 2 [Schistosoma haematobium]KAH9584515.1 Stress response protein nst1, variant 2 [Schistosoma haematobium]